MSHDVLVINAGSSSIKVSLYVPGTADEPELLVAGQVEGIGTAPPRSYAAPARRC